MTWTYSTPSSRFQRRGRKWRGRYVSLSPSAVEYYDASAADCGMLVEPDGLTHPAQDNRRWFPVLEALPGWFGLHAQHQWPNGARAPTIIVASHVTAEYYMTDHSPGRNRRYGRHMGRHTVAATLNRLDEVLSPEVLPEARGVHDRYPQETLWEPHARQSLPRSAPGRAGLLLRRRVVRDSGVVTTMTIPCAKLEAGRFHVLPEAMSEAGKHLRRVQAPAAKRRSIPIRRNGPATRCGITNGLTPNCRARFRSCCRISAARGGGLTRRACICVRLPAGASSPTTTCWRMSGLFLTSSILGEPMSQRVSNRHEGDLGGRFLPFGNVEQVGVTVEIPAAVAGLPSRRSIRHDARQPPAALLSGVSCVRLAFIVLRASPFVATLFRSPHATWIWPRRSLLPETPSASYRWKAMRSSTVRLS